MSLALVTVPQSDFDTIYQHLVSFKPPYRNMHLREARQRDGQRDLRYLHAMHANRGPRPEIEGMISGLDVFWHYRLLRTSSRTQLNVLAERGSSKEMERIGRQFLAEVMSRVNQERDGAVYYPRRTPGQFYLRRRQAGSSPNHRHCIAAVSSGILDPLFVSNLAPWDLELFRQ